MVGRNAQMRCAVLEHREHRRDDRSGRADLDSAVVGMPGARREELPEELVGSVDEMNAHPPSLSHVTKVTPGAWRQSQRFHPAARAAEEWNREPRTSSYGFLRRPRRGGLQPLAGAF